MSPWSAHSKETQILPHDVSGRQPLFPSSVRCFYYMYLRVLINHLPDFFMGLGHCEIKTQAGAQVRVLWLFLHTFVIEVLVRISQGSGILGLLTVLAFYPVEVQVQITDNK